MSGQLVEGLDYDVENGLFVFTAKYLRERGYCCESGAGIARMASRRKIAPKNLGAGMRTCRDQLTFCAMQ